jgi:hypothetical protein
MLPTRRAICASILAGALLVVGCTSGGVKRSAPATARATTTTAVAEATVGEAPVGGTSLVGATGPGSPPSLGPTGVAGNIGACPSNVRSLKTLNRDVQHRGQRLVPFAALEVRLCAYAWNGKTTANQLMLSGSGWLESREAAAFEDETNQLPRYTRVPGCDAPAGPTVAPGGVLLTFAGDTAAVSVYACSEGGVAQNGAYTARESPKWLTEVLAHITGVGPRFGTTEPVNR